MVEGGTYLEITVAPAADVRTRAASSTGDHHGMLIGLSHSRRFGAFRPKNRPDYCATASFSVSDGKS